MTQFDDNGQEGLQIQEFANMCKFLMDPSNSMPEEAFKRLVQEEFFVADSDHDGQVSMDEFQVYYWSRLRFFFPVNPGNYNPQTGAAAEGFKDLWLYFVGYASRGYPNRREKMTCVSFLRLVKNSGLLNPPKLTEANATICFLEAWAKSLNEDIDVKKMSVAEAKKRTVLLDYKQFLFALKHVAQKRGFPLETVIKKVLEKNPPKIPSSSMDFVVMAPDDYVAPATGSDDAPVDITNMSIDQEGPAANRVKAMMRESVRLSSPMKPGLASVPEAEAAESPSTSMSGSLTAKTLRESLTMRGRSELGPVNLLPRLKDVFQKYCADMGSGGGLMSMEPSELRMLLEKARLWGDVIDPKTLKDIFRTFATESLHFYQFLEALKMVAGLRRVSLNEAVEQVVKELHPLKLNRTE